MGATVTCNKAAAAFRTAAGTAMYVLFEETYEKNCHPHTPDWSCCFIGSLDGALERIFSYASSCSGGSLQGPRGSISPEGYIADWLDKMAHPSAMPDDAVTLWCGNSFRAPLEPDRLPSALDVLRLHGLEDEAQLLEQAGRAVLSLHAHAEAVAALARDRLVTPWRLVDWSSPPRVPATDAGLAYAPAPTRQRLASRMLFRLPGNCNVGADTFLAKDEAGTWRCCGEGWDLIQEHVQGAWRQELTAPGSYRQSIAALRRAIRTALPAPAGTEILVYGAERMCRFEQDEWSAILKRHMPLSEESGHFRFRATPELRHALRYLRREHVSWFLPSTSTSEQQELFTPPALASLV